MRPNRFFENMLGCFGATIGVIFYGGFIILGVGGYIGGTIYGLYSITKNVDDLRHIQPSNCTILDAQVVTDSDDNTGWVIHVNFTVPPAYDMPPNTTAVGLLQGTNLKTHYGVNQTLPCWVSTKNLDVISLSHSAADGGTIFGIFFLCLMTIPILIGLFYVLAGAGYFLLDLYQSAVRGLGRKVERGAALKRRPRDEETPPPEYKP